MKKLCASHLDFELPLGSLELRQAIDVLDLVRRISNAPAQAWRAHMWSGPGVGLREVDVDPESALRRGVEEDHPWVTIQRMSPWPDPVEEKVAFGFAYGRGHREVRLSACVTEPDLVPFFVELCELLAPRNARFVPIYQHPLRWQDVILEMALQRDYTLLGRQDADSPSIFLAKGLASVLPRLAFAAPMPVGLPHRLGWLNHWPEEVAAELGFPDPGKDGILLPLCRRTRSGAWIVQLTPEPLDLGRADHLEAVVWAYTRFDKIGRRRSPVDSTPGSRARKSAAPGTLTPKVFSLRERDEKGQWWESEFEPIQATSAEDALRIHFARIAHSRLPEEGESLDALREVYDRIAAEVGLARARNIEAGEE